MSKGMQKEKSKQSKFCELIKINENLVINLNKIIIIPIFELKNMGQNPSFGQGKSMILSNWTQIQPNSSIIYNKVTNQQVQRHEVLINNKTQLTSYTNRMKDHSPLVCRLIYFHAKSTPKSNFIQKNLDHQSSLLRPKSMMQQTSKQNISILEKQHLKEQNSDQIIPSIYCLYTDRMICIKQWTRQKLIDVVKALKYLTKTYGYFKIRQNCICENQRKEIKVWINENHVSNFLVETVQTQEDMIADLAALLVSKKQKIAKELLELQYFDDVLEKLAKCSDINYRKSESSSVSKDSSKRQSLVINKETSSYGVNNNIKSKQLQSENGRVLSESGSFSNLFVSNHALMMPSNFQGSKFNPMHKTNISSSLSSNNVSFGSGNNFSEKTKNDTIDNKQPAYTQKYNSDTIQRNELYMTQKSYNHEKKQRSELFLTQKAQKNDRFIMIAKEKGSSPKLNFIGSYSRTPGPASPAKNEFKVSFFKKENQVNWQSNSSNVSRNSSSRQQKLKFPQAHKKQVRKNSLHKTCQKSSKEDNNNNTNSYSNINNDSNPKIIINSNANINTHNNPNQNPNNNNKQQITKDSNFCIIDNKAIYLQKQNCFIAQQSFIQRKYNNSDTNFSSFKNQKQLAYFNTNKRSPSATSAHQIPSHNIQSKTNQTSNLSSTQQSIKPSLIPPKISTVNFKKNTKAREVSCSNSYIKILPNQTFNEVNNTVDQSLNVLQINKSSCDEVKGFSPSALTFSSANKADSSSFKGNVEQNHAHFSDAQSQSLLDQTYISEKGIDQKSELPHTYNIPNYYSKILLKYESRNQISGKYTNSSQNIVSQKSPDIKHQLTNQNLSGNKETKKSFPKYLNERKNPKSIPKYPQSNFLQRKLSKLQLNLQQRSIQKSNNNQIEKEKVKLQIPKHKNIPSELLREFHEKNQAVIFNQQKNPTAKEKIIQPTKDLLRYPREAYEPRKKFPSTIQANSRRMQIKYEPAQRFKHSRAGTEVDSQQKHTDNKQKNIFQDLKSPTNEREKLFRNNLSNNNQNNELISSSKGFSHHIFKNNINTQSFKDYGQFDGSVRQQSNKQFFALRQEGFVRPPENRQSLVDLQSAQKKQSVYKQPVNDQQQKNERSFPFLSSSSKPSGFLQIEQFKPYLPTPIKNRVHFNIEKSQNSTDEKQTLPRTTADQRQRQIYKATRTAQMLNESKDLHRSDPGHKYQQIVGKIDKERAINNDTMSVFEEKIDIRQHPKFKKWQPSNKFYGNLIIPCNMNSGLKRKEHVHNINQGKGDGSKEQWRRSVDNQGKDKQGQKKQNGEEADGIQQKKKIRKEVFVDYKGLFGEQNLIEQRHSIQEQRQKQKKMQFKKRNSQQEKMLQSASSKDLLIQEKVQKQKEKHAQLKVDLSKLFSDEF